MILEEAARSADGDNPAVSRIEILLAEDNPGDVFLIRSALNAVGIAANLHVVEDGEKPCRLLNMPTATTAHPVLTCCYSPQSPGKTAYRF